VCSSDLDCPKLKKYKEGEGAFQATEDELAFVRTNLEWTKSASKRTQMIKESSDKELEIKTMKNETKYLKDNCFAFSMLFEDSKNIIVKIIVVNQLVSM
jgi:hypothetical protein